MGFVCLIEVHLHIPASHSLKGKRQVVRCASGSGAAVAEVDGQDTWQRATLLCALVGQEEAELGKRADRLEGIVVARAGEGASFRRDVRSLEDLRD